MSRTIQPRVVIAGLAGDTGKTLVSLGVVRTLTRLGYKVAPFKKGPDYIDAAWLAAAADAPGRNLDTFIMSREAILASLSREPNLKDITIIEGNRGLFDGMDVQGSHSTAELAKLISAKIILVVDATKSTRTVAALVKGCQSMDPELELSAVILNRVGTDRQRKLIREAIWNETGLPTIGTIPKLTECHLPSRHLGLVTAMEYSSTEKVLDEVGRLVEQHVDVSSIIKIAKQCSKIDVVQTGEPLKQLGSSVSGIRIGVFQDRAFSFYYPENLTALEAAGAELVKISPLEDITFPDSIHGLYAGGGFPEVYAAQLSSNRSLKESLSERIVRGLPVWAECGGLMYLSKAVVQKGTAYPMVGALPIVIEQTSRPQGHGYVQARVERKNPFFSMGCELRGHEFHYSHILQKDDSIETILQLERGIGIGGSRDGLYIHNVVATYTHLHALGTPQWAEGLLKASSEYKLNKEARVDRTGRKPVKRSQPTGLSSHRRKMYAVKGQELPCRHSTRPGEVRDLVESNTTDEDCRSHIRTKGLKIQLEKAVRQGQMEKLESLISTDSRAVRHLLGLTYQMNPKVRKTAVDGIALAGKYHPKLVKGLVSRLVGAMKDDSGTFSLTVPEVLNAIALTQPLLLLPVVPDLVRLADDSSLGQGLRHTLRKVVELCPGKVGERLSTELNKGMKRGGFCSVSSTP